MKLDKALTTDNMNRNLLGVQYAVRGAVLDRAHQLEKELEKGVSKSFESVVRANIGDCHALGQKPVTFIRQVLALAACPQLTSAPGLPADVRRRARLLLDDCTRGSTGSYSSPAGLTLVRQAAAEYLSARDGVPAAPEDIYLGSGATDLIRAVLTMFAGDVNGKPPAVMIPIPQYPLFSATLAELALRRADYFLDEEHDWALQVSELERSWQQASADSHVRALVIINPGNPTGQVLARENMEQIVRFAHQHELFLLADEVYQENVISKPFHSFKKVMHEMGPPYSDMELASFLTCSKGWAAECGLRAGLVELVQLQGGRQGAVAAAFRTARSVAQCPSVLGQCALHCVVKPPAPGEPSYELFRSEKREIQLVLQERAAAAWRNFNGTPGCACNPIHGSMFAFPRVEIPERAQRVARARGLAPDELYCLLLLEETGVCVTPGSGFGQLPGTFHFRTTILHSREEFQHMMDSMRRFHLNFLRQYS